MWLWCAFSHPLSCRLRYRLCSGRRRCWRWRRISLSSPDNWSEWESREGDWDKLSDCSWSCLVFSLNWKHQEKSTAFNGLFLPVSQYSGVISCVCMLISSPTPSPFVTEYNTITPLDIAQLNPGKDATNPPNKGYFIGIRTEWENC